ncbi:unnamed protein product [Vitrella brassicaformis CCMP3155]|uniref:Uncharacterized protein n=1 Tax=Vitrella brassicaformis (strain CCMP3155) TaxID=1169540 RepID=A0A0G4H3C1_VITBC|nr:unnamed protein product [Vitrella brassicaformis CCMP3155]|eukprot:CEM37960.1 unnamed protein product [Vitrella brassicaformis CCMP3155]
MDLKPADAGAGTVGTGVGVGAPVGGKLAIDSKAKDILGEKHPHHPAVFASVDGEGNLDVWDLNKDLESPHVRVNSGESAMNHLCWSPDGRRLVSGTSEGIIAVWNVDKELTTPKPEDWARLEEQIMDLKPADAGAGTVGTGVGVGAPVGGKLAIDSKAKDILGEK